MTTGNSGRVLKRSGWLICIGAMGCAPGMYVQKNVLYVAPTLSSIDLCRQGLCVLPAWDERMDSPLAKPSPREISAVLKQKGHRQLKLVPFHRVRKRVTKQTGNAELLSEFQREAFKGGIFKAPDAFWQAIKPGYFLRLSVERGERVKLFNEETKITVILRGDIYHVPARRVVWQGRSVCKGKVTREAKAEGFVQRALESLAELLPVNPKVSYIEAKDENW